MTFSLSAWCALLFLMRGRTAATPNRPRPAEDLPATLHKDLGLPPASDHPLTAAALRDGLLR